MRFQCRIEQGFVIAPQPPLPALHHASAPPPLLAPTPQPRPTAKRRGKLARGAVASAVLIAVVGCATVDPSGRKPWTVEPVFSVTHSGQSSQAYYALGQYFDGSMAWDKAIDAYRKAIAADARNVEAYGALGVALAQAGRFADAEITLRQAVALAPDLLRVRNNLGYVLLLAGKPDEAVVVLKSVVDRDGGNAIATANLNDAMARSNGTVVASSVPPPAPVVAAPAVVAPVVAAPVVVAPAVVAPVVAAPVVAAPAVVTPAVAAPAAAAAPMHVEPAAPAMNLRVGYAPTIAALEERVARVAVADLPAPAPAMRAMPALPGPSAQGVVAARQDVPPASRVEVSNGNGVTGMAARVGRWLATQGVATERLTNRQPFAQRHTIVQYRAGREDAALQVARLLPVNARAEPQSTAGLHSDVRVVLGHDWVQVAACMERNTCRATSVALAGASDPKR